MKWPIIWAAGVVVIMLVSLAVHSEQMQSTFAMQLLNLTNQERHTPLSEDSNLDIRAAKRADFLCYGPFNHNNWDAFFASSSFSYIGENLAKNFGTNALDTNVSFMTSPKHRANIMDPEFDSLGIAHAVCPKSQYDQYGTKDVTVELFGGNAH